MSDFKTPEDESAFLSAKQLLEELEGQLLKLKESTRLITDELKQAKLTVIKIKYGVYEGAIVIDSSGQEYLVESINSIGRIEYGKPWIKVYKRNKTGEWSKKTTTLYSDWEPKENVDN